jgi:hypothetical protein
VDSTAIRQKIELPHASGECSRRKSLKICDQVVGVFETFSIRRGALIPAHIAYRESNFSLNAI